MKILYINEYFTESRKTGANIMAYLTYEIAKRNGHDVYFYASKHEPFYDINNKLNSLFPIGHTFGSFKFRLNALYNEQAKKTLSKILVDYKPDIIHIHAIEELSFSILKAIKKSSLPYIITIHDSSFACPIMGAKKDLCYACSESIVNCIKNKCSRDNYFCSFYVALKFLINKMLIKSYKPKSLIIPSKALASYIVTMKSDENIPLKVLPNCLDQAFSKTTPNFSNKKYFLFVGNLNKFKGVPILLQAIKSLPSEINFRIVGSGINEEEYNKFVIENNINNVEFLGKMNRSELIEEYKNCIAIIVPSICFEIFGMINIEAFACGKPVIASNIGGIPEIVKNNINGLLFEPGNVEQLKERILKYWNNPELAIEHGKNGYKKAISQYTEEKYYNKLIKIYEEVLNESK